MYTIVCVLILLCAFQNCLESNTLNKLNANNDHGFWCEQNITGGLSKNWSFILHTEQHWGADYSKFYNQIYDLVLLNDIARLLGISADSIVKSFQVGGGYDLTDRIQKNTKGNFYWVLVRRSILEADALLIWRKWQVKQRLRGEYEDFVRKHYINYSILRYRLIVNSPWKFTPWNINPYFSNEFFIRKNTFNKSTQKGIVGGLYSNRFRIGLNVDLIVDKLFAALYWQWRLTKHKPGTHPRWFKTYQIGLAFNFSL